MNSSRQSPEGSYLPSVRGLGFRLAYVWCTPGSPVLRARTNGCQLIAIILLLMPLLGMIPSKAGETGERWAILIIGTSGDPDLQNSYLKEVADLHAILSGPLQFGKDRISVLFDDPSLKPDLIQSRSTFENLKTVCRTLAGRVKKEDSVFVFIDGHGSYDGKIYKLNLVGPDPTAEDLAAFIYSIPAGRFIVVNATSCSGGSIPSLSQAGSILITATKSGMEKNLTHMGRYFIDAFKDRAADSDKNERISIMEAFHYLSLKVEDYYSREQNLQTEHPVLDDNGDARAQSKPSPENGDGLLASIAYLDAGIDDREHGALHPEHQELAREAQEIEKQIESLKYAKGQMPEAEYEQRLEELLLKLARINEKLAR